MSNPSRLRPYRRVFSILALLLLVGVGAATVFGVRLLAGSNERVEQSYRVLERIEAARATLTAAQAAGRGYRLTSHRALRGEFERVAPEAVRAARDLAEATRDNPSQYERARAIHEQSSRQVARMQELLDLQEREGAAAAMGAMRAADLVDLMHRFNQLCEEMRAEELDLLAQRRSVNTRNAAALLSFILLSLGVSLATLWALLSSLSRENSRNRRLERETRAALEGLQRSQALTERLSAQRWALSEYTGMLQSAQNLDEAMELTSATFERLLPHLGGQCYLSRASRDFLESRAAFGQPAIASSDAMPPDDCWALRRGQPHHLSGGAGNVRCAHLDHGASMSGVSTLCVPLTAHGETLGMLHASGPAGGGEDDNDAAIIELLGEQLAIAIANLRLRETLRQQSLRDPLTGLFNRRYFEESLRRETLRCERKRLPLALLVLDVDHFKAFNDSHGHSAGDAVLAHVGRSIASLVRVEDLACRYGGEEFTIVMPEAGAESAVARAAAIRRAVSQSTIEHNGRTLGPVTLSIGVAAFPRDGVTPELLFEVADAALYRAKAEGRNRVIDAGTG
ncbi:sensor domain-containing diguanylate cyclase [Luteimonas arsenica]|uniref:sensor domain-containing diguanylate cyclase n=1 Tax=Luteimonas arsenica TaxID=1586242 RepID=UPI001054C1D3|nr:diguanylate cyclase [Luteimonas arsenica]